MKKQYTILMVGLTLICAGYANGLTKTEKKILNYVEKHSDEAINLLENVVNINSGSLNIEGNRKVGKIFQRELDKLGF